MTLCVLSPLPVTAPALCHLFTQTRVKQHSPLPCWSLGNIHTVLLAETTCFLLRWLSFPPLVGLCLRSGGGDPGQRVGNPQPRVAQQGHGRVGLTAVQHYRSLLWAYNEHGLTDGHFLKLCCARSLLSVTERQGKGRPPSHHRHYCHHHHHHHHLLHLCYGLSYSLPKNVEVLLFLEIRSLEMTEFR